MKCVKIELLRDAFIPNFWLLISSDLRCENSLLVKMNSYKRLLDEFCKLIDWSHLVNNEILIFTTRLSLCNQCRSEYRTEDGEGRAIMFIEEDYDRDSKFFVGC